MRFLDKSSFKPEKSKIWGNWQRVYLYLATLVGESPRISTYFAGSVEGVGGGGPTKKPTLKSAG